VLLKNPCSRYVVGNRFLWLRREQERRQKWKDEVPASGHDKELFLRKWGEISGLGVYPSLCELVEGIVTVAQAWPFILGTAGVASGGRDHRPTAGLSGYYRGLFGPARSRSGECGMSMSIDRSFGHHVQFLRDVAERVPVERVALEALRTTAGEMVKQNPARAARLLCELSGRLRRAT
jgi:hypothetical protein